MSKKATAVFYFGVCTLEGLWHLFLWNPNQSGIGFLGLSGLRLILVASIALAIVFLTLLAASQWLEKVKQETLLERLFAHRFLILLAIFLFAACLVVIYLLVFSPLRIERLYGYSQRWGPVLVWWMLIAVQFFGCAIYMMTPIYWVDAWGEFVKDKRTIKFRASGLNILNPRYHQHTSPFIVLDTNRSIGLASNSGYSSWIFSSALFRLSILACAVGLFLQD
jgi:hypothetical protein